MRGHTLLDKRPGYYLEYTRKNELIVVIQAVEIDQVTVVGFRYLNGGNGSVWFGEVSFFSDKEMDKQFKEFIEKQ